jgi:hypothetical protein
MWADVIIAAAKAQCVLGEAPFDLLPDLAIHSQLVEPGTTTTSRPTLICHGTRGSDRPS